jgi:hypothetical protein
MKRILLAAIAAAFSIPTHAGFALDQVSFRRDGHSRQAVGKIVVESQDGGVLLEDRAGALWAIQPGEIIERHSDDKPFERWDAAEIATQLNAELPGFRIHNTSHYVIAYNTSQDYARWCGSLFERLFLAFSTFWKQRGLALDEPPGPMLAVVFDTKQNFARYAQDELKEATPSIVGYYSLRTNRITMYDLTGLESLPKTGRGTSADHINRLLSLPQAERTVATIIHEATHQLAFNGGLQTRYADIPLWVSEGIAVYFEAPDLQSRRGWRSVDNVNRVRLADFQQYSAHRPADSLESLVAKDDRFRNTGAAPHAYSEAWAFNYFLLHKRQEDYVKYLKVLSAKLPLRNDEPQERLDEFRRAFGDDLQKLDTEFMRYMGTVR